MTLLADPDINVNCVGVDGMTPLILASYNSHSEAVTTLLAFPDINVNAANSSGMTAFIIASPAAQQ